MLENNLTNEHFKLVVKIILFILLLFFLYFIRDILIILFTSFVLAAIIMPIVDYFEKQKVSRVLSSIFIYLFGLFLFVSLIYLVIPPIAQQANSIIKKLVSFYQGIVIFLGPSQRALPGELPELFDWQKYLGFLGQSVFSFLGGVIGAVSVVFLIIIISFYIVIEKNKILKFITSLFSEKHYSFINRLFIFSQDDLKSWGIGRIICSLFIGVSYYIIFRIIGIPFAASLAIFAALADFVPWVGPFIGAIPAVLLALLVSPIKAVVLIVFCIVIQQIESNVVTPQVMKKAVGLDPIVVITVLLIGAKVGGILGVIIAIPATAVVSIFIREFLKLKRQLNTEKGK